MLRKIFIHAPNIHQGGGFSLLMTIFNQLPRSVKSVFTLDARMQVPEIIASENDVRLIKPSVLQRFFAELWLVNNVASRDTVLCFGNLPPLFKLRGYTVVFLQNRYLVEYVKLSGFSFKHRLRITMERWWLSRCMANVDEFVVQTPSMKILLEARIAGRISVHILPFVANNGGYTRKNSMSEAKGKQKNNFLYVASGEPHKNHRRLVDAWCVMAEQGLFPSLKLTVDCRYFPELCSWMTQKIEQYRLKINNVGSMPHTQVQQLYNQADALIYPSILESFGLPLVEARQAGLPILAPELDYVRDVVDPEQTFDPLSAISIAKAVNRFMGIEEPPLPLQNAGDFVRKILEGRK